MPTINVKSHSSDQLQAIADTLSKSRKVVVITGAGISTSCGIPDFRSENGLYALLQAQYDAVVSQKPVAGDVDDRPTKRRRLDRSFSTSSVPIETEDGTSSIRRTLRSSRSFSAITIPPADTENENGTSRGIRRRLIPGSQKISPCRKRILRRRSATPIVELDDLASSQSSTASSTRHSLPNIKGKDLFDSNIWSDALSTSIFYMFISSLRQKILNDVKTTTETHKFIRTLRDAGRLVRNYTQNIDMLESREGLCTELERGTGTRTRFSQKFQREARPNDETGTSTPDSGVEVVHLHGSLDKLRCGLCAKHSSWDEDDRHQATLLGEAPDCPWCVANSAHRQGKGRRSLTVGRLRPDIVLYGEEHPSAHLVAPLITHDLSLGPDILLILGTSLRVHGLKVMIREFAKAVHGRGGKVIFVNMTKPPESIWGDVLDYWIEWDCDSWVTDLKERRKEIWSPLGTAHDAPSRDERPKAVAKNPAATRPDVTNGAYLTMKIVDQLGRMSGRISITADHLRGTGESPVANIIEEGGKKRKKPSPPRPHAVRPNKENGAYLVYEILNNLRRLCAGWVANAPQEEKSPLGSISVNINSRPSARLKRSTASVFEPHKLPTPPSSDQSTPPLTPGAQRIKSLGSISAILSSPLRYWRDR